MANPFKVSSSPVASTRSTHRLRLRAWPAWLVSLVVHIALLSGVMAWVHGSERPELEPEVEAEHVIRLSGPLPDAAPKQAQVETPHEPASSTMPAALSQQAARRLDELASPQASLPAVALPGDLWTPSTSGPSPDVSPRTNLPTVGGPLAETQFFGTQSRGTRFVFVIDRSASMKEALAMAKQELLRSLEQLPASASFQVVLYDLEPQLLEFGGQPGLLPAIRANRERTARHLETIRSEGGTDHVRALKRALSLGPQVIYFLTDADELKPGQVQELTTLNGRGPKAVIHCIELSDANQFRTDNPMRLLAQANRGEFRGINLDKFRALPNRGAGDRRP